MKISIVIPVYKTPRELFTACMDSVLSWPGEDVEFVLVIDSPGHPIEQDVYAYAAKDKRVCVLRNDKNRGPSYSRNRGIDMAKGDYVMMVDADDRIVPSVCQKALDDCHEQELAYCAVARVYPWQRDGIDCVETRKLYCGSFKSEGVVGLADVLQRLDMSSSGVWYARAYLNAYHLRYPEELLQNEDFVFTTSILSSGAKVGIWDEYGYVFAGHANSLSRIKNQAFYLGQLGASLRIVESVKAYRLPISILHFYANHAYNQTFAAWHCVPFESDEARQKTILALGRAARDYLACYRDCLSLMARIVVRFVTLCPSAMFHCPPFVNYAFRALRKFGWYFNGRSE